MPTIQNRRATAAQWTTANPVLAAGEIGFELDTNALKVGDGITPWGTLRYLSDESIKTLVQSGRLSEAALNATYAPGVSVLAHGAVGDGSTDDTAAINAAIAANPGRNIVLPTGPLGVRIYLVDSTDSIGAAAQPVGIKLNQPGVTLTLEPGVILKTTPNDSSNYAVVQVTAPDCAIIGGTIEGDRLTHTGTSGEWGHCIDVNEGADRFTVTNTRLIEAWGDGCQVMGKPHDVSFVNVTAQSNRRQGLSIIDAIRPRVLGGVYSDTKGSPGTVGLGCGILLEPDHGTPREVIDALVVGALCTDNWGPGVATSSNGRPLSATIVGVRASGTKMSNGAGFRAYGDTNQTEFISCVSVENLFDGYRIESDCDGIVLNSCISARNARFGFSDSGTATVFAGCVSHDNEGSGYALSGNAPALSSSTSYGDAWGTAFDIQVDVDAPDARLSGVLVDAKAAEPNYGIVLRPTATGALLLGCDATGVYTSGPFLNLSGERTFALPTPGSTELSMPNRFSVFLDNSGESAVRVGVHGDAVPRVALRADGAVRFSNGADAYDTGIERIGFQVAGTQANNSWRTGVFTTATRPSASTVGAGSQIYDTTLGKPIWSDGTWWRDAAGTNVS